MITIAKCDHQTGETNAGQLTYQVTGICPTCKLDLDHEYFRSRVRYIDNTLFLLDAMAQKKEITKKAYMKLIKSLVGEQK